jgi:hypothetical protein
MVGIVIHEDVVSLARSVQTGSKHARADKTSKKVEGNHPLYVVMLLDWAGRGGCCMRDRSTIFLQYLTALLLERFIVPPYVYIIPDERLDRIVSLLVLQPSSSVLLALLFIRICLCCSRSLCLAHRATMRCAAWGSTLPRYSVAPTSSECLATLWRTRRKSRLSKTLPLNPGARLP